MTAPLFEIDDLHVRPVTADSDDDIGAPEIVKGVSLTVRAGEVHALMGPNGSGKSTLASVLLGSPGYEVTNGRILFKGDDITNWGTDVRGKAGLFLAFQDPQELAGVSALNFMQQALSARKGIEMSVLELRLALGNWMDKLGLDRAFLERHVNEGFSPGEKGRNEILQMAMLEPEMAVLDETDSGLDTDALAMMANGIQLIRKERPELGTLAIANDRRLLDQLQPDHVHILFDGQIVASGGAELARQLDRDGYESFR